MIPGPTPLRRRRGSEFWPAWDYRLGSPVGAARRRSVGRRSDPEPRGGGESLGDDTGVDGLDRSEGPGLFGEHPRELGGEFLQSRRDTVAIERAAGDDRQLEHVAFEAALARTRLAAAERPDHLDRAVDRGRLGEEVCPAGDADIGGDQREFRLGVGAGPSVPVDLGRQPPGLLESSEDELDARGPAPERPGRGEVCLGVPACRPDPQDKCPRKRGIGREPVVDLLAQPDRLDIGDRGPCRPLGRRRKIHAGAVTRAHAKTF